MFKNKGTFNVYQEHMCFICFSFVCSFVELECRTICHTEILPRLAWNSLCTSGWTQTYYTFCSSRVIKRSALFLFLISGKEICGGETAQPSSRKLWSVTGLFCITVGTDYRGTF